MDWSEAICRLTAELDARGQRDIAADPTLTHDVTSYVLDGTDPRVLRRLAAAADGARLAMRSSVEGEHPARGLYDQFTTIPPEVLVRWGQALDAAGGSWTQSFHVGGADWPAALLGEVGHAYPHGELPFDFFDFAGLLASAEVNSGRLVVAAWATGRVRHYRHTHPEQVLARLRKYGAAVDQLHEWLAPLLIDGDTDHRLHAFEMLAPAPDDVLATYAAQVAASATGGSARIREVAVPLLDRIGATAVVHLRTLAVQAKPEQRRHALQLLWDAGDDEQRVFARATGLADRAASVRSVVDDFAGSGSAEAVPLPAVPEPEPVDWVVEWTGELAELLATVVAEVRGWHPADWRARPRNYTDAEVLGIFREQLTSAEPVVTPSFGRSHFFARSAVIRDGIARGVLGAPAIVKLLMSCDLLSDDYAGYAELRGAAGMLHACSGLTLLDLATLLGAVPTLDGVEIAAQAWFHDKGVGLGRDWEQDAVWPFFARHLDGVLAYWRQRRTGYSHGFDSEALSRWSHRSRSRRPGWSIFATSSRSDRRRATGGLRRTTSPLILTPYAEPWRRSRPARARFAQWRPSGWAVSASAPRCPTSPRRSPASATRRCRERCSTRSSRSVSSWTRTSTSRRSIRARSRRWPRGCQPP